MPSGGGHIIRAVALDAQAMQVRLVAAVTSPLANPSFPRYSPPPDTRAAGRSGMPSRAFTSYQEMEMPKMKTKSAAKKRFSVTASGRIKAGVAGKRHGMIKRSTTFVRQATGTMVLSEPDTKIVKKYMPYDR
jgi:large subunit ribosomal protein L35